ncbi:MAG: LUD domain-containing protein [Gammaproteobacteria bacterium]|nr:LUD domain-containing protein [Gammaproteobacteria bacterium]
MTAGGARSRILARVRAANRGRTAVPHPGPLPPSVEPPAGPARPAEAFGDRFRAAGGEMVRLGSREEARSWLEAFAAGFRSVSLCEGIPGRLRPPLPELPPEEAELGVSMAVGAAAQTGSLLLSSREGRRPQLLPPTHLVWVHARDIRTTLTEALAAERAGLPATIALHSGPSKSADIGQIMVTGVHGPGRIVAVVLGEEAAPRRADARQGKGPRGDAGA